MFGNLYNKIDSHLLSEAITFFKVILNIHNDDIPVEVELKKKMKKNINGNCRPIFDENLKIIKVHINLKDDTCVMGVIEALAHEMVHAKQLIKGESTFKTEVCYLLRIIPYAKVTRLWKEEDVTNLSYYEQPAEIEAHLLQKELVYKYVNYMSHYFHRDTLEKTINDMTESIMIQHMEESFKLLNALLENIK